MHMTDRRQPASPAAGAQQQDSRRDPGRRRRSAGQGALRTDHHQPHRGGGRDLGGRLYRFYTDRQEIFDAIAVRELEAFRAEIERAFSARQLIFSPRKSLGRVLDSYVAFLESRPHFRELALGNHISERVREKARPIPRRDRAESSATCW